MDIPERAGKKKSPAEIRRFLSSYAVLPYLLTVLMNFIAYYGAKLAYLILDANGRLVYHDLTIAAVDGYFERNASHFRWFIIIYIFYFIFWFAGYWIIAGEERENAHSVFAAAIIGMTVCMICFILLPTTLDRPVLGDGDVHTVWDWLTRLIYTSDAPNNLFPSIHCMTSYMVVRGTWKCRRLPLGYKLFCLFACIAIFASTLFVRQHLFADQIAAVALAELSMLAERALRAGRLFDRLESRIGKGARR